MLGLELRLGVCKSENKNHGEMEFNMISTDKDFGLGLDLGLGLRLGLVLGLGFRVRVTVSVRVSVRARISQLGHKSYHRACSTYDAEKDTQVG